MKEAIKGTYHTIYLKLLNMQTMREMLLENGSKK